MTDEAERKAMEWLEHQTRPNLGGDAVGHLRTLKALLSRPVLPDLCDHKAIDDIAARSGVARGIVALLVEKMREPPVPRTKEVEVWRVEWAEHHHVTGDWLPWTESWPTEEYIRDKEEELRSRSDVACVRVTGPHKQTVPA